MVEQATRARADAIESFAIVLREVREIAGNPSFREMSGRSRAISHTTLHEAAQGNRLPSWATTVEFCKACGADPAEFRERWEHADQAVVAAIALRRVTVEAPAAAPTPAAPPAEQAVEASADPQPPASDSPDSPRRRPVMRWAAAGGAAAAIVAGLVVVLGASTGDDNDPSPAPVAGAHPTSGDCPVHRPNPPAAPPLHPGDHGAFIADITLPDCSHIVRGSTVTKIWRLKNIGKVPWDGYSLHRLDLPQRRDQCQTITDVPIADTAPDQMVDVRTQITAPTSAGFCFVRFRMVDSTGAATFPGGRPVNFQVVVD